MNQRERSARVSKLVDMDKRAEDALNFTAFGDIAGDQTACHAYLRGVIKAFQEDFRAELAKIKADADEAEYRELKRHGLNT